MKLFVVIIHFGNIETTKKCIGSLMKNDKFPKTITVVNNTTDSIEKKLSKKVIILNSNKNLGFAKGVNKGISYALKHGATHVMLLNNDAEIVRPFIEKLTDQFGNKHIGIVGPAISFKKNGKTLFDIGGKINKLFLRTSHKEVQKIQDKKSKAVDYVSGCCMVIKKEVFKKIGLFDESFFLYYEDADFCLRAKKTGFATYIVPSVVIHHLLSASKGAVSSFTIYHYLARHALIFCPTYNLCEG